MQWLVLMLLLVFALISMAEDLDEEEVASSPEDDCYTDRTRGLYLPYSFSHTHCCKFQELQAPLPCVTYGENSENSSYCSYFPYMEICVENVKRMNDTDDLPTLMSKVQACIDQKIIGKPGSEIGFKTFVAYRVMNYTNDSGVHQTILDANKECPEGDKQTEVHWKLSEYFWCFHRNEAEVCNKPSDEVKEYMALKHGKLFTKINETCLQIPKSVNQLHNCCRGKPTRLDWSLRPVEYYTENKYTDWESDPDPGDRQQCFNSLRRFRKNSWFPCDEPSGNLTAMNDTHSPKFPEDFPTGIRCMKACIINPIIVAVGVGQIMGTNETSLPKTLSWKSDSLFYGTYLNANIHTELNEIARKLKSEMKFPFNCNDVSYKGGKTLDEIEKMYLETNGNAKGTLYCVYYDRFYELRDLAIAEVRTAFRVNSLNHSPCFSTVEWNTLMKPCTKNISNDLGMNKI